MTPHQLGEALLEVPADRQGLFTGLVLALEFFVVVIFSARDLLLFYLCFEAMLIPVYFLIGCFGGQNRQRAALKFRLYSLAGGLIMLIGVIAVSLHSAKNGVPSFLIDSVAANLHVSTSAGHWIFLTFFIAFAIKAPLVPVHTWLPDTAEQATPGTSVLLIGILDKIGTFGMIALCLQLGGLELAGAGEVLRDQHGSEGDDGHFHALGAETVGLQLFLEGLQAGVEFLDLAVHPFF